MCNFYSEFNCNLNAFIQLWTQIHIRKFENNDIKQCQTRKLRTIEPDHDELSYPDVTFSSIINLPSSDFQKIVRDLAVLSDKLEIKSVGNELIFKCEGNFSEAEIHRAESDSGMERQSRQNASRRGTEVGTYFDFPLLHGETGSITSWCGHRQKNRTTVRRQIQRIDLVR